MLLTPVSIRTNINKSDARIIVVALCQSGNKILYLLQVNGIIPDWDILDARDVLHIIIGITLYRGSSIGEDPLRRNIGDVAVRTISIHHPEGELLARRGPGIQIII